jgi:hypothetical protein
MQGEADRLFVGETPVGYNSINDLYTLPACDA